MSKYSGKCDFCDTIYIYLDNLTIEDFLKNTDIYIGDNIVPLRIDTEKEAVAYYPFITGFMYGNKEKRIIKLSTQSFIDEEEQDRLSWCLKNCIKAYNRYKRKKKPFIYTDELIQECLWNPTDYEKEILKRVCENGIKATTDGIHTPIHERYRNEWYNEMLRVGWNEDEAYRWVYGFSRWIDSKKDIITERLEEYNNERP